MSKAVTVILPDDPSYGPAMRGLTDKQRIFVQVLLDTGGTNETAAARAAYPDQSENSVAVTAHRMAHSPKIIAAIREEAENRLASHTLLASSQIAMIARDVTHKDCLKACTELLNRGGLPFIAKSEHKVLVTDERTEQEMLERIRHLALAQGLDPKKLLGTYGVVVDAEFTEVEQSTEGLEDMLG